MSRALVLVAGLYVFLSPVVINKRGNKDERKQVLKVAMDMNKAKGTTNNRAIECSLCAPFRYLLFSFTIFFSFIFLSNLFFLASALLIFFSQQGAHKNKPQKI
jgi:PDZ domain-containing secreted protein